MKNLTKIQILTLVLIVAYLIWEFIFLARWKANLQGAPIRVDLLLIYPVLLVLIVISLIQVFRKNKK